MDGGLAEVEAPLTVGVVGPCRAIGRMTSETLIQLQILADTMLTAAMARDVEWFLDADIQFHRTLVETANWPRLRKIWESLHPQTLTLYTGRTLKDWSPVDHARRHDPLLAAIRSKDPDAAAAAIREHILGVSEQVRRLSPAEATPS